MKYQIRVTLHNVFLLYYHKLDYPAPYRPIQFNFNPDFKTHSFVNQLTKLIKTIENDFET